MTSARVRAAGAVAAFLWFAVSAAASPADSARGVKFWHGPFEEARRMAMSIKVPMLLVFGHDDNPFSDDLDSIVLRNPDVVYFVQHIALPVRVRGELSDSETTALIARYRVRLYPTVIMTKSDGTEIDRIVGATDARSFLIAFEDFLNNKNTVGALRERAARDTADLEAAFLLARRHELRYEVDSALPILRHIVEAGRPTSVAWQQSMLHLATYDLRTKGQTTALETFAVTATHDSSRREALLELGSWYLRNKHIDSAIAKYTDGIARWPRDAAFWNNRAWTRVEGGRGLDTALADAERAIALDSTQADYFDTKAEALAGLGRTADAVAALDRALALRPGDAELLAKRTQLGSQPPLSGKGH